MSSNLCSWLYNIALQLNIFSNYKSDIENFKFRDFVCTYLYIFLCISMTIVYGIYYFKTDTMTWECKIYDNNTCSSDHLKGGGACCIFVKDTMSRKIIHFMSIAGGILSSILLVVLILLNILRIIDRKFSDSNILSDRPNIENCSATEIELNSENTNNNNNNSNETRTISEITKMDENIDNCINSISSRPVIKDSSIIVIPP